MGWQRYQAYLASKVDITMTATLRPELVRETLTSFCNNLFTERDRYRLIVNIDPVGEKGKQQEVVDICKGFFKDVVYNLPAEPSFPKAVKWVWEQANADFIFHLEDDWLLTTRIDINHMIIILVKDESIACLRLPKTGISPKGRIRFLGNFYDYAGDNYFVTNTNNHFGLNPVLIKKVFVKTAVPILVDNVNPEKQFRPSGNEKMNTLINSWKVAIYASPGSGPVVIDNGVSWKQNHRFKKPSNSGFLVWEKY